MRDGAFEDWELKRLADLVNALADGIKEITGGGDVQMYIGHPDGPTLCMYGLEPALAFNGRDIEESEQYGDDPHRTQTDVVVTFGGVRFECYRAWWNGKPMGSEPLSPPADIDGLFDIPF